MGHQPRLHELLHQGGSGVAVGLLLLHDRDFVLQGIIVGEFGRCLLLLDEGRLLLCLNLCLGASALAACLEQVG